MRRENEEGRGGGWVSGRFLVLVLRKRRRRLELVWSG